MAWRLYLTDLQPSFIRETGLLREQLGGYIFIVPAERCIRPKKLRIAFGQSHRSKI
jgi:hypothetical protein